jgi:Na+-driven multidrug efflux pump
VDPFATSIFKGRWSRDRQEIYSQDRSRKMFSYGTPRTWTLIAAIIAVFFGLLTIKEGGSVLLGNEQAVSAAGDYVPFVLWFNTAAGFAYVAAGVVYGCGSAGQPACRLQSQPHA